jgi:di/tricarboxylate transporter
MSIEIILIFSILILALVLFFTGWVRMDIVALLLLPVLTISGLLTPDQAVSGFSNPAVITIWSMYILSAAFSYTGVARMIGKQMFRFSGQSEWRMIMVIMLISGAMSSVMNNIGVAALMLPVVMDISRSTGRPASRLLLPLVTGIHLGGLITLIGNPANLVVSVELEQAGFSPLSFLDFTPMGVSVLLAGTLFVMLAGRHLLSKTSGALISKRHRRGHKELTESYDLSERTFQMEISDHSSLAGKTLADSYLRPALGINVLSVKRQSGHTILNPGPDHMLHPGDKLFVQARFDAVNALNSWKIFMPGQLESDPGLIDKIQPELFEVVINPAEWSQNNPELSEGLKILAVRKNKSRVLHRYSGDSFDQDDVVLVQENENRLNTLLEKGILLKYHPASPEKLRYIYHFYDTLYYLRAGKPTELFKSTSPGSFLPDTFGLKILAIKRGNEVLPPDNQNIQHHDYLLIKGDVADLSILKELLKIHLEDEQLPTTTAFEDEEQIMAEVVLAPRSALAGKTLKEINFRKKYGISVIALWREGSALRTNIHLFPLRFGEAMLLYGNREKIALMGSDTDFILLTDTMAKPLRTSKAVVSLLIMAGVLLPVMLGYLPIEISSVIGVALMVLTGCLTMEEAYQSIEWKSVFLIAGLLPLGLAMQQTGAAHVLADGVEYLMGGWGPWGIITGIYILTIFLTLALHPAALVVIISPVVLQSAQNYGLSPHSLMIMITVASSSILSPIAHPANLLIMGPGGYKFTDYIKFGMPLVIFLMAVVYLILPLIWPLT